MWVLLSIKDGLYASSLSLVDRVIFLSGRILLTTRSDMYTVIWRKIQGNQRGITGLETAIIMIAFVVVASVFAYVVLSAGLFASQKSQESVYAGIKTAQNTIEMKGALIAVSETPGVAGSISQFTFTLTNSGSGSIQDFTPPDPDATGRCADGSQNKVVISYVDPYQKVDDLFWTMTKVGASSADNILDKGEIFQITVGSDVAGAGGGNLVDALGIPLSINTTFTLEVKPPVGATLILERTTPCYIDPVISLH